jgi:hypothetical protein
LSSNGIESHGALHSTCQLHEKNGIVLEYIVMDDDSTMINILQWDYDKAIKSGLLMMEFPRSTAGRKKPNKGCLPVTYPAWMRLDNHNHCV